MRRLKEIRFNFKYYQVENLHNLRINFFELFYYFELVCNLALSQLKTSSIATAASYPYGTYPDENTADVLIINYFQFTYNLYIYLKKQSGSCKYNSAYGYAKVVDIYATAQGSESDLKQALANNGVVSIIIDATTFQFYGGGIFTGMGCSSDPNYADHAVSMVGYAPGYFLLRNSQNSNFNLFFLSIL